MVFFLRLWPSDLFGPRSTVVPALNYINTWLIFYPKAVVYHLRSLGPKSMCLFKENPKSHCRLLILVGVVYKFLTQICR